MTCKDIKIERNIVTNNTTVETVSGAFLFNNINFPDNPTTGALHIVKFDNGLYVYEYTNQQWVLKIFHKDETSQKIFFGDLINPEDENLNEGDLFISTGFNAPYVNSLVISQFSNGSFTEVLVHNTSIPTGTTEERPEEPTPPSLRFNTTDSVLEYFNGTDWIQLFGQQI